MTYTAWSVVAFEQPTAAKWNQLGENDAGFRDGSNILMNNNQALLQKNTGSTGRNAVKRNASNNLEVGDSAQAALIDLKEVLHSDVQTTAEVGKSAAQSISNTTNTTSAYNTETVDTGGMHDNAVNNSRLTIPTGRGGKYFIYFMNEWASNSAGIRHQSLMKNGAADLTRSQTVQPANGDVTRTTFSTVLHSLVAADYIEINVFQSSGGALNLNNSSIFGAIKLP